MPVNAWHGQIAIHLHILILIVFLSVSVCMCVCASATIQISFEEYFYTFICEILSVCSRADRTDKNDDFEYK